MEGCQWARKLLLLELNKINIKYEAWDFVFRISNKYYACTVVLLVVDTIIRYL